jgi:phytoene dehydrogenase-like protein
MTLFPKVDCVHYYQTFDSPVNDCAVLSFWHNLTATSKYVHNCRVSDIIVIGSGHNGLVAAAYLAKAGLSVQVLEANDWIGGCTSSTYDLIPETPEHLINPCAQDICLLRASSIVEDLDLRRHGYRDVEVDPAYVAPLPDGSSLAFWRDMRRTVEELKYFSKRDAREYARFADLMDAAMGSALGFLLTNPVRPDAATLKVAAKFGSRHPRKVAELLKIVTGSAADAIDERFRHPIVRGGLASLSAVGAPITHKGSGINALFPGIVSRVGVSRPLGGTQVLPDSLVACLTEHGGSVRTKARVAAVTVRGDTVTGVRLESGEELTARAVVAGCDPSQTLNRLVPAGLLPDRLAKRAAAIPTRNEGSAYFTVHLAFDGRLEPRKLQAKRRDGLDVRNTAVLAGSFEDMVAAVGAATTGELPDPFPVACVLPTGPDPSQAPAGKDTIYLWTGWAPGAPTGGWTDALKAQAADRIVKHAAVYYENLEEIEAGRFVETAPILAERTNAPNGNPYHVDLLLARSGAMRPALGFGGYRTPVPGLYLTGAGTHPGPAVSGIPGQLAAQTVLRTLGGTPVVPIKEQEREYATV